MPVQTAPPQVTPVVHQYPVSHSAGDLFNDNGNSSESSSRSTGVISQESASYNSQVNVMNNSSIGYGVGQTHPIPIFYGHMTMNPEYNYYEAVVGIAVPLGGKSKKESLARLKASRRAIEIDNRFRTMSGCASIASQGYIIDYSLLAPDDPLLECQTITARAVIELPPQRADHQAQELIEGYRKQQLLIQKLLNRIDQLENENGTNSPFRTPG